MAAFAKLAKAEQRAGAPETGSGVRRAADRKRSSGVKAPINGTAAKLISYRPARGVRDFVRQVREASPMQLVETERAGISGMLLKDMAREINVSVLRLYEIVGVAKATAEKKIAENGIVSGAGGQAAIGLARLLGIAHDMVDNSTASAARGFDAAQWFGKWIEVPQPALGGRKPADLLDTPTGVNVVARILGALQSGAYV